MKNVVAGVIRNKEGKIFIAKRNLQKNNGGLWEFPGGKVEENEAYEIALVREIKEEFNMDIEVDSYIGEKDYDYGDRHLNLIAFNATMISDSYEVLEHEDSKWVTKEELLSYECPILDKYFFELLFSLGTCPGVGLLGHMVVLFLVF